MKTAAKLFVYKCSIIISLLAALALADAWLLGILPFIGALCLALPCLLSALLLGQKIQAPKKKAARAVCHMPRPLPHNRAA